MKDKSKMMMAVSIAAVLAFVAPAYAETAEKTTTTKRVVIERDLEDPAMTTKKVVRTTKDAAGEKLNETRLTTQETVLARPGSRMYNIKDFDLNGDGVLTVDEIGEKLFRMYDADGNNVLDNIEYGRRTVLTVVPVEKNMKISYDFDGDGIVDEVDETSGIFLQRTQLTRFDKNLDGLSPREFTGRHFMQADVNNDKAVDLSEWRGSYIESLDKRNHERARFND